MGMSTHITGFKPADEKWKQMKKVWDACEAADVNVPKEVYDFFGGETPDPAGVQVDLKKCGAATKWSDHDAGEDGYEVDVKKLPPDVTVIRFFNSW